MTVTSIYKPPPAKLSFPDKFFNFDCNNIIIGDLNCYNHIWGYNNSDDNSIYLAKWLTANQLFLTHDPKQPAMLNSGRWKRGYNPDLAMVSNRIHDMCNRTVLPPIPRSQHRPHGLVIKPAITPIEQPFHRHFNLQKAKWDDFTEDLNVKIDTLGPPIWQNYDSFINLVLKTAHKHIPQGCRTSYINCDTYLFGQFGDNASRLIFLTYKFLPVFRYTNIFKTTKQMRTKK